VGLSSTNAAMRLMPENQAALSRKWARAAALSAMQAL
jgi:hypothetical protein